MGFRTLDCLSFQGKSTFLQGVDACLFCAHSALGYRRIEAVRMEGNHEIEFLRKKPQIEALGLRILAGVVGFTVLLPITFIAFVIKACALEAQMRQVENLHKDGFQTPIQRSHGLTPQECAQIDRYVEEHRSYWKVAINDRDFQPIRIPKEESGLPRTLHIVKDNENRLRVMVLCKRKNVREIGKGQFNTVTLAVDWLTVHNQAEYFAFSNTSPRSIQKNAFQIERAVHGDRPSSSAHIKPASFGHLHYVSKGEEKLGFFDPLYEGTLRQTLIRNHLTREQKMRMIKGLLQALVILEQREILHRDLDVNNIFVKDLMPIVADFGISTYGNSSLIGNALRYRRDCFAGKEPCQAPEKRRTREILYEINKDSVHADALMDRSLSKHDIWEMGIVILSILENNWGMYGYSGNAQNKILERTRNLGSQREKLRIYLLDDDTFLGETFGTETSFIPKLKLKDPLYALAHKMLQYDYRQRPSAQKLLEMFSSIEKASLS